jgi:hypothetical protein
MLLSYKDAQHKDKSGKQTFRIALHTYIVNIFLKMNQEELSVIIKLIQVGLRI